MTTEAEKRETARRVEYLPLRSLVGNPKNAKDHDLGVIHTSIDRFGFIETIIRDDRTGMIISGHGRTESLRQMRDAGQTPPDGIRRDESGDWLVPVLTGWASRTDLDASAALIALNRTVELGGWVDDALLDLLDELQQAEGLDGVGYDDDDIDDLRQRLAGLGVDEPKDLDAADDDDVEPAGTVITQRGDLWVIGGSRLICGDSTDPETFERLMGEAKADCIWTDPPYGVSYVGKTKDALKVHNDAPTDLQGLLNRVFTLLLDYGAEGAPFYVAAPSGPMTATFISELNGSGMGFKQILVWVKSVMVMGHSDYHYQHELVYYGHLPGTEPGGYGRGRAHWYGGNAQVTVFKADKPSRNAEHPTMKPISLVQDQLANSLPKHGLVLDPFGGSGTTMLAAHSMGGTCHMVEFGPEYADVIVRRMAQHFPSLPYVLIRDGKEVPAALEQVQAAAAPV